MPELAAPLWLLLLPVPLLVLRIGRRWRGAGDDGALLHPQTALLARLQTPARGAALPWVWLLGCALLVVALARPQWIVTDPEAGLPGHNVIFAIDVSGSMRILDYELEGLTVSRLDMLKHTLTGFLDRASRLRAGLVVFGDDVMTWSPLTTDLGLAAQLVADIDNSLAGERTALGDAMALSIRRLEAVTDAEASRILVLLTDGVPTAGTIDPTAAADLAAASGIRVYTVGIGTEGPAPFPLGRGDEQTVAEIPLDEAFLEGLATRAGGAYYRIRHSADLLQALDDIDRLERSRLPARAEAREWYWLPALVGLALLVFAERRPPLRTGVPA